MTVRYDQRGNKLPLNQIFKELSDMWVERTGKLYKNLGEEMNVADNIISRWRGDNYPCPWWAILFVCGKLNLAINLRADSITIVRAYTLNQKRRKLN